MTKRKAKTVVVSSYKILVKKIQSELTGLDFFVKRRTAESYWRVGKFIHEHLLVNQERANYGDHLFERLANDIDRESSTLQKMLRFYRAYPILARGPELTWSHYRALMSIKDNDQRKHLEKQIIQKNWNAEKFQKYLSAKRELPVLVNGKPPIPQPACPAGRLKFTRGKPNTFKIIKDEDSDDASGLSVDFGFRMTLSTSEVSGLKLKEGDFIEIMQEGGNRAVSKVEVSADETYTYIAKLKHLSDADTYLVKMKVDFGVAISQKLRLRGINCPERGTPEGERATKFVKERLSQCPFLIIKTYKDRFDKWDRYLADVFYKAGENDPGVVAREGKFLNQELLDNGHAEVYEK